MITPVSVFERTARALPRTSDCLSVGARKFAESTWVANTQHARAVSLPLMAKVA